MMHGQKNIKLWYM